MINLNKILLISFLSFFVLNVVLGQNNDSMNSKKIGYKKNIHEITYKPALALGYSYIRNFNNKFLLGAEMHLGGCFYFPFYSDFLYLKLFTRNLFSKRKNDRKWDYDIGLFSSYSYASNSLAGLSIIASYNIWRFNIGVNIQGGFIRDGWLYKDVEFFEAFTLNPVLTYKF